MSRERRSISSGVWPQGCPGTSIETDCKARNRKSDMPIFSRASLPANGVTPSVSLENDTYSIDPRTPCLECYSSAEPPPPWPTLTIATGVMADGKSTCPLLSPETLASPRSCFDCF